MTKQNNNIEMNSWETVKVETEKNSTQQNINITVEQKEKSIMWILSIVFWLLGIFTLWFLALIWLIMWIVALFKKDNIWLGIAWVIVSIIWIVVSPTVWVFFAGIFWFASM